MLPAERWEADEKKKERRVELEIDTKAKESLFYKREL